MKATSEIIVGCSGSGMSFALKYRILQALKKNPDCKVIVVVTNHAWEYMSLVKNHSGVIVSVAQKEDVTISSLKNMLQGEERLILVDLNVATYKQYEQCAIVLSACQRFLKETCSKTYLAIDNLSSLMGCKDHDLISRVSTIYTEMRIRNLQAKRGYQHLLITSGDLDVFFLKDSDAASFLKLGRRMSILVLGMAGADAAKLASLFDSRTGKKMYNIIIKIRHSPRPKRGAIIRAAQLTAYHHLPAYWVRPVQIRISCKDAEMCSAFGGKICR